LNFEPPILFISRTMGGWKKLPFEGGQVLKLLEYWKKPVQMKFCTNIHCFLHNIRLCGLVVSKQDSCPRNKVYLLVCHISLNLNISISRPNIKNLVSNFGAIYVGYMHANFQASCSPGMWRGGGDRRMHMSCLILIENFYIPPFASLWRDNYT